jgi:hypothetical protein
LSLVVRVSSSRSTAKESACAWSGAVRRQSEATGTASSSALSPFLGPAALEFVGTLSIRTVPVADSMESAWISSFFTGRTFFSCSARSVEEGSLRS